MLGEPWSGPQCRPCPYLELQSNLRVQGRESQPDGGRRAAEGCVSNVKNRKNKKGYSNERVFEKNIQGGIFQNYTRRTQAELLQQAGDPQQLVEPVCVVV